MTDIGEPIERPPATDPGLASLAGLLAALLTPASVTAVGRGAAEVADALRAAGVPDVVNDGGAGEGAQWDLVVALDADRRPTADGARSWVSRLTEMAGRAVVFGAAGVANRSAAWWDDLFSDHDFEPVDVLRAALWDDPAWDAAVVSSLTLYVRSTEQATIRALQTSAIPRSAVHPGVLAPAWQASEALRQLARRLAPDSPEEEFPATVLARVVGHHAAVAADARTEVGRLKAHVELLRACEAKATVDAKRAETERRRAEEARQRAESEAGMLRDEIKRLLTESSWADDVAATSSHHAVAVDAIPEMRQLFDQGYYLEQVPGLVPSGMDPFEHYLREGWARGLDPHPLFDSNWYRRTNPSLFRSGVSPLEHFVSGGWRERRDPHPLFDVDWYLRREPDVAAAGMNPLLHYLQWGWHENRDPHPLFQTAWYRRRYPHLEPSGMCLLVHYVRYGWHQGYELGEMFDAEWYLANHPEAEASGLAPYRYFLEVGVRRGDRPSPWADDLIASAVSSAS